MLAQLESEAMEEEPVEEEVPQAVEEPVAEQALPEEILNTIKDTEIAIAADEEVTEDITSKDDVAESTAAAGATKEPTTLTLCVNTRRKSSLRRK